MIPLNNDISWMADIKQAIKEMNESKKPKKESDELPQTILKKKEVKSSDDANSLEETILQMFLIRESEETGTLNESLHSVMGKMGLHVHKSKGLLGYLASAGKGVGQLIMAAIKGDKEQVKSIAATVDRADVIDFLLRLDMLTLHMITGPIHIIDAITGLHIGPALKDKLSKGGDVLKQIKKAFDDVKTKIKAAFDKSTAENHIKQIENIESQIIPVES